MLHFYFLFIPVYLYHVTKEAVFHPSSYVPALYWRTRASSSSSHCSVGAWSNRLATGDGTLGVALLWIPGQEGRSTLARAEWSAECSRVQWWYDDFLLSRAALPVTVMITCLLTRFYSSALWEI